MCFSVASISFKMVRDVLFTVSLLIFTIFPVHTGTGRMTRALSEIAAN